jgi:hypothetical protein
MVLEALESRRYVDLLDALVKSVAGLADPDRPGAGEVTDKDHLRAMVRRRWKKLDRHIAHLERDPSPAVLHRTRIVAKRCRAALGAADPGSRSKKLERDLGPADVSRQPRPRGGSGVVAAAAGAMVDGVCRRAGRRRGPAGARVETITGGPKGAERGVVDADEPGDLAGSTRRSTSTESTTAATSSSIATPDGPTGPAQAPRARAEAAQVEPVHLQQWPSIRGEAHRSRRSPPARVGHRHRW